MDRELNRAELDELLPLFALDAVDGDEREQVARYVERDAAARAEVQSLREAAALLARFDTSAPESLWSRIEESLGEPPAAGGGYEAPRLTPIHTRRVARRRPLAVAAAVLGAAAISAITILGIQVAREQDRIDQLATEMHHNTMRQQAEAAQGTPGAHTIRLASSDGAQAAEIVMLPDGTGYFMHDDLPRLKRDRTYQLWAAVGDGSSPQMVSVGVLGGDPGIVAFRLAVPALRFEVTQEAVPGNTAPGPVVVMDGVAT